MMLASVIAIHFSARRHRGRLCPGSPEGITEPAASGWSPPAAGGVTTIDGHGFGHGRGRSQWGAYGAAKVAQLSANQILHFYYPHTTLATKSTKRTIRVFLSAAGAAITRRIQVAPATGLAVTPA